ncbi:hypothetical protein ETAA8_14710 [Anatilimnocola aggregata]|uniref:Uncharacterized protein n=2 Tax=Anatilimnocola aggregata TaxID=2528021 RepID=A0A517Y844_9BACT|nr:hypothetical protein ETAA8_14710 [Anatilimnocola aggregata]
MNLFASMMPALSEQSYIDALRGRRRFLQAGAAVALGAFGSSLWGADPNAADSSHQSQVEAARAMPLSKLNEESQRKVLSVLERPSIYRRLPGKTIDCDPELFVYLVRNPEVVVNIWELMGVSQMVAERTSAFTWKGNDGQGTESNIELVYGTDELHLLYGEGFYEGPLLKRKVAGRAVILLRTSYGLGADGRAQVSNKLDVFIAIDNVGAELLAKTLQPMVGSTADVNFTEAAKFLGKLSQTAETNPDGMPRLAQKLNRCNEDVKRGFTSVATSVGQRVAQRTAANNTQRR